jgi:hypothetical protein
VEFQVCPDCGSLFPRGQHKHRSRICDGHAPTWAADTRQRFFRNDEAYAAEVRDRVPGMKPQYREVVVTAPGVDGGLPWDESRCSVEGPHRHSGDLGCRVLQPAADLWNDRSRRWWTQLHQAAQLATLRAVGSRAYVVFKIPEVHKRGVRHWHVLLGYTTPLERAAVDRYLRELDERSPRYGFGFCLPPRERDAGTGAGAAYFASYFVDGKGGKASITEAVKSPVLDGCSIYVSPRLTTRSGITMRSLRLRRYLWWRIGAGGLRLAEHLGLGINEVYELHEHGFWGSTLLNMLVTGEVQIE